MSLQELLGWVLFSLLFWGFALAGLWLNIPGLAVAALAGWILYVGLLAVLPAFMRKPKIDE